MSGSNIFCGFRNLGSVSNHIPLCTRYITRRRENLVVTSVGKVFHTYGCDKLRLLSISNPHPSDINCLTADNHLVFSSCQNIIRAWRRGTELKHTYNDDSGVHILLPLGPFLISINENNVLKLWDIKTEEKCLELSFEVENLEITALMHPNTYMNKILVGSKQGKMQIWNIKTSRLIYTFNGWNSSITIIEQAPAIDVVAVGLSSGEILLHNLKFDETLMKFKQEWGPVTSLSFRLDGQPIMTTGSSVGHIAVWNLEKKKLISQIRDAHSSSVTGMKFLPDEALLLTSSPDNSLKMWVFDQTDDNARLLKLRQGHSAPPTRIRFYGNDGQNILSAGQDSTLKSFSTVADMLNKNLGTASLHQKAYKKHHYEHLKMPPIIQFDSEPTREREWDNVAGCHRGCGIVSTWSTHTCKLGSHHLRHERFKLDSKLKSAAALCIALTSCGNFVIIGYDSGHVDVFNIQSGIHRGEYGKPRAHKAAVTGVVVDGLNHRTITGGIDQKLKFWKFKSKELIGSVNFEAAVSQLCLHRESNLLACILDDFSVSVFDIDTRKVVRILNGHTNPITDLCFSPDSRWLVTSSMDSTIRTWDIPTGSLIDCFCVSSPAISISMSPTADYLATCHVDQLSIYLWANKTLYSHVSLRPLPEDFEPASVDLPTSGVEESETAVTDADEESDEFKSPQQISDELVTLSLLPHSRWRNLLVLDVIKKRNKPKEPPAAPKSAPFFLPTVPGLTPRFDVPQDENKLTKRSNILDGGVLIGSEFEQFLSNATPDEYITVLERLKQMGPSAVYVEIRSLSPVSAGKFLDVIKSLLNSNMEFEVIQAYLALFLKIHWDVIAEDKELLEIAQNISTAQKNVWERIQKEFHQCLCLVNFLKNAAL